MSPLDVVAGLTGSTGAALIIVTGLAWLARYLLAGPPSQRRLRSDPRSAVAIVERERAMAMLSYEQPGGQWRSPDAPTDHWVSNPARRDRRVSGADANQARAGSLAPRRRPHAAEPRIRARTASPLKARTVRGRAGT